MLNVAFMAAIFTLAVSICLEFFTAVGTGEIVVGFSIHHVHMLLPPMVTAGIAAEQILFMLWLLLNFRTAILAIHILVFCVWESRQNLAFTTQSMTAAERFDCFQFYPCTLGYAIK